MMADSTRVLFLLKAGRAPCFWCEGRVLKMWMALEVLWEERGL